MPSDEKDFCWLCNLLALTHARVPLIETLFLHKDEISLWVRSSKSGKVKKKPVADLPDRTAAAALNYFMEICDKETPGSEAICMLTIKGVRVLIDWERVEDLPTVHTLLSRSNIAQGILEENEAPPVFLVRLEFQDREYSSDFLVRRQSGIEEARNPRIWYKALSLTKVVIGTIEKMKKRMVDSVELEFLVDESGDVFLYGCPSLKLQSSVQTRREAAPQFDLYDIIPTKSLTKDFLPTQYRFSTPPSLRRRKNEGGDGENVREGNPRRETPGNNGKLGSPRSLNSPPQPPAAFLPKIRSSVMISSSSFSNPNFRELIALNYAKNNPSLPKENLEIVLKTMDEAYLREEEAHLRVTSPTHTTRKKSFALLCGDVTPSSKSVHRNSQASIKVGNQSLSTPAMRYYPQHKSAFSLESISEKALARHRLDPVMLMRRRAETRKSKYAHMGAKT